MEVINLRQRLVSDVFARCVPTLSKGTRWGFAVVRRAVAYLFR